MEEELIQIAVATIVSTNNFIHGIDHIVRVYDLAVEISNGIDNELTETEKKALKIACYWHDIGRIDSQNYKGDYNHADNSAESLLIVAKRFDIHNNPEIKYAVSAIKNHRRNNGKINTELKIDQILWDADKLDIFNARRIKRIINDYKEMGNIGEYNINSSLKFWNSINNEFSNNLHFKISKEIFDKEYPEFKKLINKIMKEVK